MQGPSYASKTFAQGLVYGEALLPEVLSLVEGNGGDAMANREWHQTVSHSNHFGTALI
jgi:hypothetical protein